MAELSEYSLDYIMSVHKSWSASTFDQRGPTKPVEALYNTRDEMLKCKSYDELETFLDLNYISLHRMLFMRNMKDKLGDLLRSDEQLTRR